jgi:hypothetical protein
MKDARGAAFAANAAARGLGEPAKFAALSAGQAVAVAHVAAHDLGAAAYAIRAVQAASPSGRAETDKDSRTRFGNASNSQQRFDPLFWMINNDETTSVGMRSATDASYR